MCAQSGKLCSECKSRHHSAEWVAPSADGTDGVVFAPSSDGSGKSSYELYTANKGKSGIQYFLAGDRDEGDDLEDRMERLERQLEKLMDKLGDLNGEKSHHKKAHREFRSQRRMKAPRAPKAPRTPRAPRAPKAPAAPLAPPAPSFPMDGPASFSKIAPTVSKSYKLNEGQLKALTTLMVLDDVPILVSPGYNELTVHATQAQHASFGAFVAMISGGEKYDRHYALPSRKGKALSNLMSRPDVPIMVLPDKNGIDVEGAPVEQAVFKAFVDLIHPQRGQFSTRSNKRNAFYAELGNHHLENFDATKGLATYPRLKAKEMAASAQHKAKSIHKHARKEHKRARKEHERALRIHKRHRENIHHNARTDALQMVTEKLAQANINVDELRERVESVVGEETVRNIEAHLSQLTEDGELQEQIEQAVREAVMAGIVFEIDHIHAIEDQARAFAEQALDMVNQHMKIEQTHEQLEEQAEQLREQADQLKEQAEELKEKALQQDEEENTYGDVRSNLKDEWVALQEESSSLQETAAKIQLPANEFQVQADQLSDRASILDDTSRELQEVARLAMALRKN